MKNEYLKRKKDSLKNNPNNSNSNSHYYYNLTNINLFITRCMHNRWGYDPVNSNISSIINRILGHVNDNIVLIVKFTFFLKLIF